MLTTRLEELAARAQRLVEEALTLGERGESLVEAGLLAELGAVQNKIRQIRKAMLNGVDDFNSVHRQPASQPASAEWPNEVRLPLTNGKSVRFPAHPEPCSYVRVMDEMDAEVGYWNSNEWKEDPEVVMGAILGLLTASRPGPLYVLLAEGDGIENRPVILETYLDSADAHSIGLMQKKLDSRLGKTRLVRLAFD